MPNATADDGCRIHYEVFGPEGAPTVLFIRGTGADGTRWMPQVRAYESEYRCVIFDGRGVGKSDTTPPPYDVPRMAADTLSVMDAAAVEVAHISGSSLGGAIGLHLAVDSADRIGSLQMHSSWLATRGFTEYSLGLLQKILDAGGTDFYYEATLPLLFSPRYMSEHFEDLMKIRDHMQANPATLDGLAGQIAANMSHDMSADAHTVSVPTLVTVGELDYLLPVICSEELRDVIPGAELVVFEGAGHLASMESSDEFNRVTLDWLHANVPV